MRTGTRIPQGGFKARFVFVRFAASCGFARDRLKNRALNGAKRGFITRPYVLEARRAFVRFVLSAASFELLAAS